MAPPKNVTAPTPAQAAKPGVPEEYRGVKRYRVGASGGFVGGQIYHAGDVVTLVDAVPSRTWTPIGDKATAAAPATKPTAAAGDEGGRASDTAI